MNNTKNTYMRSFARYLRRTFPNKLCASVLVVLGAAAREVSGDATVLVCMLLIGIPLFITRKNYINI